VDLAKTAAIDLVEAAYNLDIEIGDWMPSLVGTGKPLLDLGLGCYAALGGGLSKDGQLLVTQVHVAAGAEDLALRVVRAAQAAGPDLVSQWSKEMASRGVVVMSELRDSWPKVFDAITEQVGCKDSLIVYAADPDCHGVSFNIPASERIELAPRERERWQMLAVHLCAGHRLRRGPAGAGGPCGMTPTEMPLNAEALMDPSKFLVSQAAGGAKERTASEAIREAAIRVDHARGKLRKSDPEEALEIWHGLVRGRWSLIDWFDTDGRRFVLAKPNAPNLGDPRGLNERELQVATYAARGESGKLIGYRFGISPQRVSTLLKSTMRKLGVKTQAQLVERMRGLPSEPLETPES
jgi:DNA-binding CsgD family transcriptional regulator